LVWIWKRRTKATRTTMKHFWTYIAANVTGFGSQSMKCSSVV
jgi:hypothetical protein